MGYLTAHNSINEILEQFSVETETRKQTRTKISPDPRLLCPIRELKKTSIVMKLVERTKCIGKKRKHETMSNKSENENNQAD
eukprot:8718190-Ditylum_brightwellii.AAC.1